MVVLCFAPFSCAEPALRNESLTELLIKTAAGTRSRTATAEVFYTEMISEPQEFPQISAGCKEFHFQEMAPVFMPGSAAGRWF